jgi:hypothetical protein
MAAKTAQQVADKWARNMANAGQSYKDGVMAVREAPGVAAARAADRMKANIIDSIDSGRYAQRVSAVSLSTWQQKTANKGAARLTQGAAEAKQDVMEFQQRWLPIMQQASEQVKQMPKGTEADAVARMLVIYRAGKQFAGKPIQ